MRHAALSFFLVCSLFAVSACNHRNDGPLEKAGREVDDAIQDVNEPKSTTEKIGEEIKDLGDRIEDNS